MRLYKLKKIICINYKKNCTQLGTFFYHCIPFCKQPLSFINQNTQIKSKLVHITIMFIGKLQF